MPTAQPRYRSALAALLIFPWFALPSFEAQAPVLPGVVIEEIPKGSALEKAGLQVGDVILSWERLPNPPANPEGASGELASYFDWLELEAEQVPRGTVVLRGRRGEEPLELKVEPGLWEAKVRPVLSRTLEKVYLAGKAQLDSGDVEAAVRAWRLLVDGAVGEARGDFRAWVALRSGDAWGKIVEWGKAVEEYQKALTIAGSPGAQIATWVALGDGYWHRNDYQGAADAFTSAAGISQERNPESLIFYNIINKLGKVCLVRGELSRAQDYFLKTLRAREKLAPQSLAVASCLNNLGNVALTQGLLDRAEYYYLQGLRIQEQLAPQSTDLAGSLNNLGVLAQDRGDPVRAYEYYLRALRLFDKLSPQGVDVAGSLNNLGSVAEGRGELEQAEGYYLQALEIIERLYPEGLKMATCLNNLGTLAADRGDLERAHGYLLRALRIQEKIAPQSLDVAASLNNLGTVATERRDLNLAHDYLSRSLQILEKKAPHTLKVAECLNNLGNLSWNRGDLERARDYYWQALQIKEQIAPQSITVASSLTGLGAVAKEQGELDLSHAYFQRALEIREGLAPESFDVAKSLSYLGTVARVRGQMDPAHVYFSRTIDVLEHQALRLGGSYRVRAGFQAQNAGYYYSTLDLLLAQSGFAEAFHVLERFRAQTFLTMLAERDTIFTADIPEQLDRERRGLGDRYNRTLKKLASLNPRDNGDEIEATRSELRKLDDEAGDVEARIRQASPRLAALKYPHPLGASEARQALDPGTLLLSYSVGNEKTTLFVLSRSGDLEAKILPLGEEALRSQVKQLLNLIREAAQGSSLGVLRRNRLQAVSRELYAKLLGPVANRIAASERLLILPDGPLHTLPFAALVRDDGTSGTTVQYLAEWKPIHIALSATVFSELKQRRRPAGENESPIQLAAFGDPVYPQSLNKRQGISTAQVDAPRGEPIVRSVAERGVFDWQPLPYTRHEVEGIVGLFPPGTARTFLGPEALEERIKSLDPKTRILHLAAHSYTDEHLPSSSFVALTIPEDTNADISGRERDNGLLQVWEIFERVRLDADLVVLSACDTGLGEEQGGEGLIGLTRAFQYAGARSVMASLWSVQDQATSELMIRFYKHLRAGLTKDEALRQAQIELIRTPIEVVNEKGEKTLIDASAPYFWAGFQVYGDWQ